jgi:hypothetical protein
MYPGENNFNDIQENERVRKLDEHIISVVQRYLEGSGYTGRKLADTPTDDLQITPRKYVNLSGVVANRPTSSVAVMGQKYFATDTSIPMIYNANSSVWLNGVGSTVASG